MTLLLESNLRFSKSWNTPSSFPSCNDSAGHPGQGLHPEGGSLEKDSTAAVQVWWNNMICCFVAGSFSMVGFRWLTGSFIIPYLAELFCYPPPNPQRTKAVKRLSHMFSRASRVGDL